MYNYRRKIGQLFLTRRLRHNEDFLSYHIVFFKLFDGGKDNYPLFTTDSLQKDIDDVVLHEFKCTEGQLELRFGGCSRKREGGVYLPYMALGKDG